MGIKECETPGGFHKWKLFNKDYDIYSPEAGEIAMQVSYVYICQLCGKVQ